MHMCARRAVNLSRTDQRASNRPTLIQNYVWSVGGVLQVPIELDHLGATYFWSLRLFMTTPSETKRKRPSARTSSRRSPFTPGLVSRSANISLVAAHLMMCPYVRSTLRTQRTSIAVLIFRHPVSLLKYIKK